MNRARFAKLVQQAIASLPEWVRPHLRNVEIVVEDRPSDELLDDLEIEDDEEDTLYGYYDGVPVGERFEHSDGAPHPVADTIYIFQDPLVEDFGHGDELIEQIRVTVVHEVGHHLGLDDDRIEELGYG